MKIAPLSTPAGRALSGVANAPSRTSWAAKFMPADSTTPFILHADAASVLPHVKLDHESKRAGSSRLWPIRARLDPNKDTPAANNPKKIALVIQTTRNPAHCSGL
jgi:hypothetical protein